MAKLKVLIAEDSEPMRKLYMLNLPEELFELRIAVDGQEAMDMFNELEPDLLLLDVIMPEKSGFTVLKEIREDHPHIKKNSKVKGAVIIMATSMDSRDDIMDCMRLGINGYLVKPIDKKTVADRLISTYQEIFPDFKSG